MNTKATYTIDLIYGNRIETIKNVNWVDQCESTMILHRNGQIAVSISKKDLKKIDVWGPSCDD